MHANGDRTGKTRTNHVDALRVNDRQKLLLHSNVTAQDGHTHCNTKASKRKTRNDFKKNHNVFMLNLARDGFSKPCALSAKNYY